MTRANVCHLEVANTRWDVVVIGGGPAGAVAARQTALAGYRTLLVDKQAFPRSKVCGACVNARAIQVLMLLGMESCVAQLPSVSLESFALHCGRHGVRLPLLSGKVIARSDFDDALVQEAIRAGARWLPETVAAVGDLANNGSSRVVELTGVAQDERSLAAVAGVVFVADGLGSPSLRRREAEFPATASPVSRVGVGGVLNGPCRGYASETIYMAISRHGYAGLVGLPEGSLNIAAALDAAFLKRHSDVRSAMNSIFADAHMPPLDLRDVAWKGTPRLTRKLKRPVSKRVFVLGDAAGYVEPFTGEGIAWAITSGAAAALLVHRGIFNWTTDIETQWLDLSRQLIQQHQIVCRLLARTLRSYRLSSAATRLLSVFPALAAPIVAHSNSLPSRVERILRQGVRQASPRRPTDEQLATATTPQGGLSR